MDRLLVVYHSRTGGTRQMAQAAAVPGARLLAAEAAMPDDLLAAAGYVFAAPENLAGLSGAMKEFFDRCYYPLLDRLNGRPYAAMVCAGSDGQGALRQIARIATGWRLRQVAEPIVVCTRAQTAAAIMAPKTIPAEALARCAELGAAMLEGVRAGIF